MPQPLCKSLGLSCMATCTVNTGCTVCAAQGYAPRGRRKALGAALQEVISRRWGYFRASASFSTNTLQGQDTSMELAPPKLVPCES